MVRGVGDCDQRVAIRARCSDQSDGSSWVLHQSDVNPVRLPSIQHIPNDVRREEGKVDHLLDAAFGGAFRFGDLCEGLAGLDPPNQAWARAMLRMSVSS
jgi:hypothetical protein